VQIFHRFGIANTFRVAHVIAAFMWIGLLWFFNFVQTPAYEELEANNRFQALDKLTWRALWWFRWSAAATVAFALIMMAIAGDFTDDRGFWLHTSWGPPTAVGIVFALVMFANVWLVIWPNQQIVIANARTVLAGGEANPDAPAAARASAMASRHNTIFSLPVLFTMVGAAHFFRTGPSFGGGGFGAGKTGAYLLIGIAVTVVFELNALGKLSGRGPGGLNVIYASYQNAMMTGFALILVFYLLAEGLLRA
jgi:hypothetical protein